MTRQKACFLLISQTNRAFGMCMLLDVFRVIYYVFNRKREKKCVNDDSGFFMKHAQKSFSSEGRKASKNLLTHHLWIIEKA